MPYCEVSSAGGARRGRWRIAYVRIAQFRFDHRLETIAAECALLLDIGTDLAELVFAQRVRDKLAVGLLARPMLLQVPYRLDAEQPMHQSRRAHWRDSLTSGGPAERRP